MRTLGVVVVTLALASATLAQTDEPPECVRTRGPHAGSLDPLCVTTTTIIGGVSLQLLGLLVTPILGGISAGASIAVLGAAGPNTVVPVVLGMFHGFVAVIGGGVAAWAATESIGFATAGALGALVGVTALLGMGLVPAAYGVPLASPLPFFAGALLVIGAASVPAGIAAGSAVLISSLVDDVE